MKKWYAVPSFTMKCRIYPNETQKKNINRNMHLVHVYHNRMLYKMKTENKCTKESTSEKYDGVVHFPDFRAAISKECLDEMREEYPSFVNVPAGAISGQNGVVMNNLVSSLSQVYANKKSGTNKSDKGKKTKKETGKTMPFEFIDYDELKFYSKKHPLTSYTYQLHGSAFRLKSDKGYIKDISVANESEYNRKALYINLGKDVGYVKTKGWNQKIRFDEDGNDDFLDYVYKNPKKAITITVEKDNCDDYYVCIKLSYSYNKMRKRYEGIQVYRLFDEPEENSNVGIDVGKKTLITTSDKTLNDGNFKRGKAENKRFKDEESKRLKVLQRRLSRRYGWSNEKFRKDHKKDKEIMPSQKYRDTEMKLKKLNRKISRKRDLYYNECTTSLEKNYGLIAIESLSVSDMFKDGRTDEQKDVKNKKFVSKKKVRRMNENTSDAAMSMLLQMIKYKSEWYGRNCVEVGQYYPSSKTCHVCGYVNKDLELKDRSWTCPECGTKLDRDENAAINILNEGIRIANSRKAGAA